MMLRENWLEGSASAKSITAVKFSGILLLGIAKAVKMTAGCGCWSKSSHVLRKFQN